MGTAGKQTFDSALGTALRNVRQQAGLTQTQAAEVLGRRQATISRWEEGQQTLAAVDVACVAQAYSTTPGQLYSYAVEAAPTAVPDEITQRARALEVNINKRR